MSGHSKWHSIKHKKGALDAKRGKIFTKIIREMSIAARIGGGDPASNPRLRTAVDKAKSVNMPADNIKRAIQKGTGELEGMAYEDITLEGYGPGGVAILVEGTSDNRNRTVSEIRHIFTKNGGNMGEAGSVAYLFKPRGVILVEKTAVAEETLIEIALEAGADDVASEGDTYEVLTPPAQLEPVKAALAAKKIPVQSAEATKLASLQVPVSDKDAEAVVRLVDALEDHDDVLRVYSNFSASDEVLARLSR